MPQHVAVAARQETEETEKPAPLHAPSAQPPGPIFKGALLFPYSRSQTKTTVEKCLVQFSHQSPVPVSGPGSNVQTPLDGDGSLQALCIPQNTCGLAHS